MLEDTEVMRRPEHVDELWDEQVDGAWAPGKASVSLFTTFLKCVQERDYVKAERAALEILKAEPNNRLVQDLVEAMKQQDAIDVAQKETDGDENDDDDEEDGHSDESDEVSDSSEEKEEGSDEDDDDEPDSNEAEEQADAKDSNAD